MSKDLADKDSSSDSRNKEWNHWVVLHGNEKVVENDVIGLGEAIGVKLTDKNMLVFLLERGGGRY